MLFYITMTHTPENCPVCWPPGEQKKFFAEDERAQEVAKAMNITIHFMLAGMGHTMYTLIESDNLNAINSFFGDMPFKQDYHVEPVGKIQDVIDAFKSELAKK
jgi:hypothetical protein